MAFEIVSNILNFLEIILRTIFSPEGAIVTVVTGLLIAVFYWIFGIIKNKFN